MVSSASAFPLDGNRTYAHAFGLPEFDGMSKYYASATLSTNYAAGAPQAGGFGKGQESVHSASVSVPMTSSTVTMTYFHVGFYAKNAWDGVVGVVGDVVKMDGARDTILGRFLLVKASVFRHVWGSCGMGGFFQRLIPSERGSHVLLYSPVARGLLPRW